MLNPNAKQQIASILGVDLRTAGPWLDCVKSVHRQADGTLAYLVDPQYEPPCTPFQDDHARMIDYVGRNWVDCIYHQGPNPPANLVSPHPYHFPHLPLQRPH